MEGLIVLGGALGWNYANHRRGRPTICSTVRRHVPAPLLMGGLATGTYALALHLLNGYERDRLTPRVM